MEKFGIFELLDTLSALTAEQSAATAQSRPPETEETLAEIPPQKQPPDAMPAAPTPSGDALAAFLARHDAMSRRAGKK